MRKLLLLATTLVMLSACTPYVQVYTTTSNLQKDAKQSWVYENDTVRVSYNFWSLDGTMAFSIYNKLDKPLYIDWKKSSYVSDEYKYDYWIDEEQFHSTSVSYTASVLGYYIGNTTTAASGQKVRPERITFLAPHSRYDKVTFKIYNPSGTRLNKSRQMDRWPRPGNADKTINVYDADFTKQDTKLIFRNFMTVSTSEKFETESYIDNEFYISQIAEVKAIDFGRYTEKGDSAFKSPDRFYIPIDNNLAIANRKKAGMK